MRLDVPSLEACEAACCAEPLCHSVTWIGGVAASCTAGLAIAHGVRPTDWCWHPTRDEDAITALRLPGAWTPGALVGAARVLESAQLRAITSAGSMAVYSKPWDLRERHYGAGGHTKVQQHLGANAFGWSWAAAQRGGVGTAGADRAAGGALDVSRMVADAIPDG